MNPLGNYVLCWYLTFFLRLAQPFFCIAFFSKEFFLCQILMTVRQKSTFCGLRILQFNLILQHACSRCVNRTKNFRRMTFVHLLKLVFLYGFSLFFCNTEAIWFKKLKFSIHSKFLPLQN